MGSVGGRAAAGQTDMLREFPSKRAGAGWCIGAWTREIDVDDGGPGILDPDIGVQMLQGRIDPAGGRDFEIEVALDAIGNAGAPECREAFVNLAADLAELSVCPVTQGQN